MTTLNSFRGSFFLNIISIIAAVIISGCAIYFLFPDRARFWTNRAAIQIDNNVQRTTIAKAGNIASAAFTVRNIGSKIVTVHGAATTCGCATINDLPIKINPGQETAIQFNVSTKPDQANQLIKQQAVLYTDAESGPIILCIEVDVEPSRTGTAPQ